MSLRIPPVRVHFPAEDRREILRQIDESLASGQLTLGRHVQKFERCFAEKIGAPFAVAVNSGTSALEIPLRIFGVRGKTVLLPTNTFFATAAAVIHAEGKLRFVDSDQATLSVSVRSLEERLTPDTAGVIVVHIAGVVTPEMPAIVEFCEAHHLFLLEDAAHAHGSRLHGRFAGTFGHAGSFSFYPTKVMTSAEGGMIVSSCGKVRDEACIYRDQGKAAFLANSHTRTGYNWRLSEPHAIIGHSQLARLEEFIVARNRIARIYDKHLQNIPGVSPFKLPEGCRSNYYKYIALLDESIDRTKLKEVLRDQFDIALSGEVYETPCHMQPVFEEYREGEFPEAEDFCRRHICLPIYVGMTDEEVHYVLSSLTKAVETLRGQFV